MILSIQKDLMAQGRLSIHGQSPLSLIWSSEIPCEFRYSWNPLNRRYDFPHLLIPVIILIKPFLWLAISWSKYCCLLIFIIILYYQKVATLPLFVTAKIQKISKNAQLYYQKVVNLPFFVTKKAQTKAFTMTYKRKVVVLPLFVTFPFSSSKKWHKWHQSVWIH